MQKTVSTAIIISLFFLSQAIYSMNTKEPLLTKCIGAQKVIIQTYDEDVTIQVVQNSKSTPRINLTNKQKKDFEHVTTTNGHALFPKASNKKTHYTFTIPNGYEIAVFSQQGNIIYRAPSGTIKTHGTTVEQQESGGKFEDANDNNSEYITTINPEHTSDLYETSAELTTNGLITIVAECFKINKNSEYRKARVLYKLRHSNSNSNYVWHKEIKN